jgi:hypothetical protein
MPSFLARKGEKKEGRIINPNTISALIALTIWYSVEGSRVNAKQSITPVCRKREDDNVEDDPTKPAAGRQSSGKPKCCQEFQVKARAHKASMTKRKKKVLETRFKAIVPIQAILLN